LLTKDGYLYMALLHSKLLDFLSTSAFCCLLSTTDVQLLLPTDCQSIYHIFISYVFSLLTCIIHPPPPPCPLQLPLLLFSSWLSMLYTSHHTPTLYRHYGTRYRQLLTAPYRQHRYVRPYRHHWFSRYKEVVL
jgi:hypothetical protein